MGLIARAVRVLRAKFNSLLATQEDPIEQLELTYQDMREERRNLKQSIVNVKAQRKSLERKVDDFEDDIEKHNQQARQAMEQGQESLARQAIEKKRAKMTAVQDLESQVNEILEVEDNMYDKLEDIDGRIEELKTQKEILKARFDGAEAMADVNESLSGELGEYSVDENVEDIHAEIDEMQSRAEAVREFDEEREEQDIESQLEDVTVNADVENEMETLRQEMGSSEAEPEREAELA